MDETVPSDWNAADLLLELVHQARAAVLEIPTPKFTPSTILVYV